MHMVLKEVLGPFGWKVFKSTAGKGITIVLRKY